MSSSCVAKHRFASVYLMPFDWTPKVFQALLDVAQEMDDVKFGVSTVADVAKHYEVAQDKVVVFRKVSFSDTNLASANKFRPIILFFSSTNQSLSTKEKCQLHLSKSLSATTDCLM